MKITGLIILILCTAGAGFAGGVFYQSRKTEAVESQIKRSLAKSRQAQARCAELQSDLDAIQGELERLQGTSSSEGVSDAPAIDPAKAPSHSGEPGAAETEPGDEAGSPRLFAERYQGALRRVDWKLIGKNASRMATLIPEVVQFVADGKRPPLDKSTEIGQLNRPVLMEALKLGEDVPGTGVNGQFTDPAFILNVLTVTLENTDMPLSTDQTERLVSIANRTMAEDTRRRAGYDDDAYELEKLLDEVELKGRFFDETFEVLTPEQAVFLSPPLTKDRIRADLFSEALLYAGRVEVFPFKDRETLTAIVYERVKQLIGSDETLVSQAKGPVERWVDQLPQEDLLAENNHLDRAGMLPAPRATRWGRHVLTLLESLVAELSMSEEMAQAIRGLASLTVPIK